MADRRGSAAIEFLLWVPILVFFVAAVIDWGFYMNTRTYVARAAMDGARVGTSTFESSLVTPGSVVVPKADARTKQVLAELGLPCPGAPLCQVNVSYCPAGVSGDCDCLDGSGTCYPPVPAIRVEVIYQFEAFFGTAFTPTVIQDDFVMAVEG